MTVAEWPWDRSDEPAEYAVTEADESDLPASFARCFTSDDGRRVLIHLRRVTLDRSLGPRASDAQLRHLEGQRCLVSLIIKLTAQGAARG